MDRLKRMDLLIQHECTGSPKEFAEKLSISESYLHKLIKDLRELYDAPISYSLKRESYVYTSEYSLDF